MKLKRLIALLLASAAFGAAILVYQRFVYRLGFPDGFISELESAERNLAFVFIGVSLAAGAFCVYLGRAKARMNVGVKLSAVIVLYSISMLCLYLTDNYFRSHLAGSAGG